MKSPAPAAMREFRGRVERPNDPLNPVHVILREVRPKDPLLVASVGVTDPSQAQDDIPSGQIGERFADSPLFVAWPAERSPRRRHVAVGAADALPDRLVEGVI